MWTYNTLIVLVGASLLGAMSGSLGCFTVLKRRALLGDVIAHSTLPGLALAFWFTQIKALHVLLAGAVITGILSIWIIALIRHRTRTKEDAAMAIVLSVFFGAGIALSNHIQNAVPDGSQAGLDSYILGKTAGIVRSDVMVVGALSLVVLVCIIAFFKEFRLSTFDPGYAKTLGWKVLWIDLGMMGLLAMAVVVGLPMVGVVMIAAMGLLPAITARFWTDRLSSMLILAGIVGILSACSGVIISSLYEKAPTGPSIILCAGALFSVSALLAPKKGLIALLFKRFKHQVDWGTFLVLRELEMRGSFNANEFSRKMHALGVSRPFLTGLWVRMSHKVSIEKGIVVVTPKGNGWLKEMHQRVGIF